MICVSVIMFFIFVNDYAANNYSFLAKSRFYSQLPNNNVDDFYKLKCSNDYEMKKFECIYL